MEKLEFNKIGIQKPGEDLYESSRQFLAECGINYTEPTNNQLRARVQNLAFEIFFLPEDAIIEGISDGSLDFGIISPQTLFRSNVIVGETLELKFEKLSALLIMKQDIPVRYWYENTAEEEFDDFVDKVRALSERALEKIK